MTKPSRDVLRLARELIKISSTGWTESQAEAFLDLLDPGIKRALLLAYLTGPGDRLRSDPDQPRNKIQAIKLIRGATGWGLKEAKEFVELAGGEITEAYINGGRMTVAVLPEISVEERIRLNREITSAGYHLD